MPTCVPTGWGRRLALLLPLLSLVGCARAAPPPPPAAALPPIPDRVVVNDVALPPELFGGVADDPTQEQLYRYLLDDDPAVALSAASRLYLSLTPPGRPRPERFVSFFRGCTGLEPPPGWELALLWQLYRDERARQAEQAQAYAGTDPAVRVQGEELLLTHRRYTPTEFGLAVPAGLTLAPEGLGVGVRTPSGEVRVARPVLEKLRDESRMGEYSVCDAAVAGVCVFLTARDRGVAAPYWLVCFDVRAGRHLWRAGVRAGGESPLGPRRNWLLHDVDLVAGEDLVAVFGRGDDLYVEVYDARSGRPLFRFDTPGPPRPSFDAAPAKGERR